MSAFLLQNLYLHFIKDILKCNWHLFWRCDMKIIQKILVFLTIFSFFIIAVGCSFNRDNTVNEDLINKISNATKSVKSTNVKIETIQNFTNPDQNVHSIIQLDMSMTTNPFIVKINRNEERNGQKIESMLYITDDTVYVEDIKNKTWKRATNEKFREGYNGKRKLANFEIVTEFLHAIQNKMKVSENDLNYEVTYSGSENSVNKVFSKILDSVQTGTEELRKKLLVEKVEVKYIIDKKTFLPIECEIKAKFAYFKDGQRVISVSLDEEFTAKFSEINEVKEIIIPEEAKNGKLIEADLSYK